MQILSGSLYVDDVGVDAVGIICIVVEIPTADLEADRQARWPSLLCAIVTVLLDDDG